MSQLTPQEIQHHVKVYVRVFAALALLTVATVAVSYMHLPIVGAVLVALAIATLKGTLVAAFFMHLAHEQKIIYWILAFTVFFFFFCLLIPSLTGTLH